ncbi:MAG: accessory gene regulator B family protein [Clostridia bacterium]|nr:accessory gene regulator B family protein [Clostridia bacterium]
MLDELGTKVSDCVSETLEGVTPTQKEIIQYTIVQLLGELIKTAIMFGIALYFGVAHLLLIAIFSMAIYRIPAGGAHSKSHIACFLASSILFFGNVILSSLIDVPYLDVLYIAIFLFNSVVIYFYAPADTEMKPVVSKKQRKSLRIISFVCMTLTMIIGRFIIADLVIRNIFIFGTLIQSITMLPFMYHLFNTKYGFRDGIVVPQI